MDFVLCASFLVRRKLFMSKEKFDWNNFWKTAGKLATEILTVAGTAALAALATKYTNSALDKEKKSN